jgi:hypothetical protein
LRNEWTCVSLRFSHLNLLSRCWHGSLSLVYCQNRFFLFLGVCLFGDWWWWVRLKIVAGSYWVFFKFQYHMIQFLIGDDEQWLKIILNNFPFLMLDFWFVNWICSGQWGRKLKLFQSTEYYIFCLLCNLTFKN